MIKLIKKIKTYYNWGGRFLTNPNQLKGSELSNQEEAKQPLRTDVINYLLSTIQKEKKCYLEIGVRNPEHNFNKINSQLKYSVDPGVEFKENPVDFKLTSDEFFQKLRAGDVLDGNIKFDVIFIDGLHLAEQVDKDIINAIDFISDDGYIVLHDCNPPTEWHAREDYYYDISPAMNFWNGTTWKAFYKHRYRNDISTICVDTDWGIGIISKRKIFNSLSENKNPFYEFKILEKNRKEALNLVSFQELKTIIGQ